MREIIDDSTIPHAQAAQRITAEGFATSETAVRRYRKSLALTLENLTSPYPRGTTAGDWQPRVDLGRDSGTFTSVPRRACASRPDDDELLAMLGLDPGEWMVTSDSLRVSRWQAMTSDGPEWLEAYKGQVRRRGKVISQADIEEVLSRYDAPAPGQNGSGVLLVAVADMQAGKPDQGGTDNLVATFKRCIDGVAERIRSTAAGRVGTLLLAQQGDCVEGAVSQGGTLPLDISITEAIRVTRRLLIHAIGVLAPLTGRMIVASVAGNHDETRRDRRTPVTDSWSLELTSAVADALTMSSNYGHVEFAFPVQAEISLSVNVGDRKRPLMVGMTHGHMATNPNKVVDWWRGQSLGNQAAGSAQILLTGHWHHLRCEAAGKGRWWIQAPALESGSDWWRHRKGDDSTSGIISAWLHPGHEVPWSGLTVHC